MLGKLHFGPKAVSVAKVSVTQHSRPFSHFDFKVLNTRYPYCLIGLKNK